MLHIALCDDNPASIEILEKYFDILNDSTIDYDVYFSAEELYRYKLNNELTYDMQILLERYAYSEIVGTFILI